VDDGEVEAAIRGWFRHLERCVRAVDYAAARPIFAPEVVGFGTFGAILDGLDALETGQWRNVWPTIRQFTFDLDSLRWGADGDLAWAVCLWDSVGRGPDGGTSPRPGRATVILRRDGSDWLAVHTHFSLAPAERARG
jgi:ketosteroid isomerase-like protein